MICCTLGAVALLAACSSGPAHSAASSGTTCGSTRTAVGVPVVIKVDKGSVDCGTAMSVENKYATMLRDGQVKGNGGGAPAAVSGWTCQGYPTPEVLATGDASQCTDGGTKILAVLPSPTASTSASTSASASPGSGG